jgi:hypothetical protein
MTAATLALIETAIAGKTVRMRFAGSGDPAAEWIEFQVIPGEYVIGDQKLSEHPDRMPLAATRLAALLRAQSVIGAEITLLKGIVGTSA